MKKTALLLAALIVSGAAMAQPHREPPRPHPHHVKKKVWVKAHREHGHMVRGHYVWR